MVFSQITFISAFLFPVFLLYILIPSLKVRNLLLAAASLVFYAVGEPVYVLLMIGSAVWNYCFGRLLGKKKGSRLLLTIAVVWNIGILVVFKYMPFGLTMPIGISFYTFQALSYVIDVYRDPEVCQKNFGHILLYLSFFPQLIAGPIIKYQDISAEIEDRRVTADGVYYGLKRFITGLAKKVLIANTAALVVDTLIADISKLTTASAWILAVGYTLQIYYDFSGYSDMAIGMGRMFGFHFNENFNYPYAASSIKEFWRRWHISLSSWFKEYVYIPLGGNRKGKLRTYINKYLVFILTGLWHGANITFLIWGLIHGTCSVMEEGKWFHADSRKLKPLYYVYTWLVVICAFVLFRADTPGQAGGILAAMFSPHGSMAGHILLTSLLTPYNIFMLVLGILLCVPWYHRLRDSIIEKGGAAEMSLRVITDICLFALLILCMMNLAQDAYNPFIYFRF